MKIALMEMNTSIPEVSQTNQQQNQLGFHLSLQSLLSNQGASDKTSESSMLQNPINSLIDAFNMDTLWPAEPIQVENEDGYSLTTFIDEKYPDWKSMIEEVLSALDQDGLRKLNPSIVESELENDFLEESIQIFQALIGHSPEWIEKIPIHSLVQIIKIGRDVQQLPYIVPTTSTEMTQLELLDQALQQLYSRLKDMKHDDTFKHVLNRFKTFLQKPEGQMELPMYKQYMSPPVQHEIQHEENSYINEVTTNLKYQPTMNSHHYQLHLPIADNDEVIAHTLLREFSSILSRAKFHTTGNTNRLLIKLYPEHLGTLQVELLQKDGLMTARLIASSNMAKNMLTSQLQSLKAAFSQQQITIDKIEVSHFELDAPKYTEQSAQDTHQQSKQHQHENAEKNNDDSVNFKDAFSQILFETEV